MGLSEEDALMLIKSISQFGQAFTQPGDLGYDLGQTTEAQADQALAQVKYDKYKKEQKKAKKGGLYQKIGATAGSFFGPIGTFVGGTAGGTIGGQDFGDAALQSGTGAAIDWGAGKAADYVNKIKSPGAEKAASKEVTEAAEPAKKLPKARSTEDIPVSKDYGKDYYTLEEQAQIQKEGGLTRSGLRRPEGFREKPITKEGVGRANEVSAANRQPPLAPTTGNFPLAPKGTTLGEQIDLDKLYRGGKAAREAAAPGFLEKAKGKAAEYFSDPAKVKELKNLTAKAFAPAEPVLDTRGLSPQAAKQLTDRVGQEKALQLRKEQIGAYTKATEQRTAQAEERLGLERERLRVSQIPKPIQQFTDIPIVDSRGEKIGETKGVISFDPATNRTQAMPIQGLDPYNTTPDLIDVGGVLMPKSEAALLPPDVQIGFEAYRSGQVAKAQAGARLPFQERLLGLREQYKAARAGAGAGALNSSDVRTYVEPDTGIEWAYDIRLGPERGRLYQMPARMTPEEVQDQQMKISDHITGKANALLKMIGKVGLVNDPLSPGGVSFKYSDTTYGPAIYTAIVNELQSEINEGYQIGDLGVPTPYTYPDGSKAIVMKFPSGRVSEIFKWREN